MFEMADMSKDIDVENTKREKIKMKVRKHRSNQSEEAKEAAREVNKKKHADRRAQLSEEEKKERREKDKERKARKKAEKKATEAQQGNQEDKKGSYTDNERELNKEYKRKIRADRTSEEVMFEDIELLLRRREEREGRPEEVYLKDNLEAKRGMTEFRKLGRLKEFQERMFRNDTEIAIWRIFWNMGESYKALLMERKPAIVEKLEQLTLQAKDLARKKNEDRAKKEKENGWGVMDGDWAWMGEGEPPEEGFYYECNLDEEEEAESKDWEEKQAQWLIESLKDEKTAKRKANNEYMKKYRKKKNEELQQPIELPNLELSDYEILRENNLKALEEAKKKSGLFDD